VQGRRVQGRRVEGRRVQGRRVQGRRVEGRQQAVAARMTVPSCQRTGSTAAGCIGFFSLLQLQENGSVYLSELWPKAAALHAGAALREKKGNSRT
jgi:hypothetical protein